MRLGTEGIANRQTWQSKPRSILNSRPPVPQQATVKARYGGENSTAKLAKFFPDATPVRIPIRLSRLADSSDALPEDTVIEFGTPSEVLFESGMRLEFADKVRVRNSDGSLDVEACIVALQYSSGRTAVAARFTHQVLNWIVKP
jgi:hypothetical protein